MKNTKFSPGETGFWVSDNAIDIAERAEAAAVVTDLRGEVVFWNAAAAKLFGRDWRQVGDQPFPEVVEGRDVFGNRILRDAQRFEELAQQGEGLHRFAMDVVDASGELVRLAVSVVVVLGPRAADERFVYELEPLQRRRKTDLVEAGDRRNAAAGRDKSGSRLPELTPRQAEIVALLAEGKSCSEISELLGISPNTVRCHIQGSLERLGVHSRTAAVAIAIRRHLV